MDSNPSLVDSNHLGQIIIRSEVCQLDSNTSSMDSNHLRKIEDRIESEEMDSNPSSTDSNLLRKIEDKTKNKEIDSNPSYMDSNHSTSFKVRSQGELHGFKSPHIGFESSIGKSCKGFESLKFRFESPRQKIK